MTDEPRRPRAFRMSPEAPEGAPSAPRAEPRSPRAAVPGPNVILDEPPEVEAEAAAAVAREAKVGVAPRGIRWGRVFVAALGGLLSLALGLWVDGLVRELFARNDWLGWVALALVALAGVAVLAVIAREVSGTLSLARIDRLRADMERAAAADDEPAARRLAVELAALYATRAETARGRSALEAHMAEVVEGRDLLVLAERELLKPLDLAARTLILDSAKRVSVVTAVSPRAVVDLLFVLVENLRLIRRLADLYGGRPGTLGFMGFAGRVVTHLGVTGSIAVGDSVIQEMIGQGLAARLSSRLGEGVVNGLLTARVGIACLDLVRPMPFLGVARPSVGDMLGELTRLSESSRRG